MAKRPPIELAGALAVVTGAGSGIGRATALALSARGARVAAVDINAEAAEKTAVACGESGAAAWGMACDVASHDDVSAMAWRVFDNYGVPDVVVNNAGVGMTGAFADMSIEDWRWIRSINLDGVVNGCMAFGPAMVRRGSGHVVNLSSGLGYTMHSAEIAYVTTKAAVLAFSRCLQAEWSTKGVGVTAICPGVINTPILTTARFAGEDAEKRRAEAQRLFKRGHKPEIVAKAIVDSVERNKIVVPVGWESRLGWMAQRVMPVKVGQFFAGRGVV